MGDQLSGSLTISPNGKLMAYPFARFGRVPSEGWQVAIFSLEAGRFVKQVNVRGGIRGLRWAASGAGFNYEVSDKGASNIWEQSPAGGKPTQLTRFTTGTIFDFNWSPDGSELLLTRGNVGSDAVLLTDFE
jgi:Tol biopolymer transport system component